MYAAQLTLNHKDFNFLDSTAVAAMPEGTRCPFGKEYPEGTTVVFDECCGSSSMTGADGFLVARNARTWVCVLVRRGETEDGEACLVDAVDGAPLVMWNNQGGYFYDEDGNRQDMPREWIPHYVRALENPNAPVVTRYNMEGFYICDEDGNRQDLPGNWAPHFVCAFLENPNGL